MRKEDILFHIYKDTSDLCNDEKRSKIQKKFPDVNITTLHRMVTNYQVKKYGCSLEDFTVKNGYKDFERTFRNARDRKRQRNGKKI
jgi:hypothetical protein